MRSGDRAAAGSAVQRSSDAGIACRDAENPHASWEKACDAGQWPHEGLAVACARRFLDRGVAMEDLLQEARAALCMAASRFDPERGVCFSTYAVPVTLGALRECCRRASLVQVPRRQMQRMQASMAQASGRSPDGNTAAYSQPQTAAHPLPSISADPELLALAGGDGFEERVLLRDMIRRLGEPYAQVIGLRYFCGLSQREVGQRLGAAQWQVCRWEKIGLGRLRHEDGLDTSLKEGILSE